MRSHFWQSFHQALSQPPLHEPSDDAWALLAERLPAVPIPRWYWPALGLIQLIGLLLIVVVGTYPANRAADTETFGVSGTGVENRNPGNEHVAGWSQSSLHEEEGRLPGYWYGLLISEKIADLRKSSPSLSQRPTMLLVASDEVPPTLAPSALREDTARATVTETSSPAKGVGAIKTLSGRPPALLHVPLQLPVVGPPPVLSVPSTELIRQQLLPNYLAVSLRPWTSARPYADWRTELRYGRYLGQGYWFSVAIGRSRINWSTADFDEAELRDLAQLSPGSLVDARRIKHRITASVELEWPMRLAGGWWSLAPITGGEFVLTENTQLNLQYYTASGRLNDRTFDDRNRPTFQSPYVGSRLRLQLFGNSGLISDFRWHMTHTHLPTAERLSYTVGVMCRW